MQMNSHADKERSKLLVILDAQSVRVSPKRVAAFNKDIDRIISGWFCKSHEGQHRIKHFYAPAEQQPLSQQLGGVWRPGGAGRAEDLNNYMVNNARSICLKSPRKTTLILCTDNPEFEVLVEEMWCEGVDVRLVTPKGGARPELARLVPLNKQAALSRDYGK